MTSPLRSVPLTPDEVDGAAFRQSPAGARGYSGTEVDAFLADVAAEMRRLMAENRALSEQLRQSDLAGHLRRLERQRDEAQERARVLESELRQAAEATAPEPNPVVVELAERTADGYLAQARREAGDVVDRASTEAALLVSDAELRASTVISDARHRHAERVTSLPAKRAAALERIEELHDEARRRREAITGEMTDRLQDIVGA